MRDDGQPGRTSTIKDVAHEAGVSVSTVSHVINGTRFVTEERRQRVLAAVERLQYTPSSVARSLRGGRTRTLGLIVPDNSNPFFAEVARAIEDVGFESGYSVVLCNSDGRSDKERAYLEVLVANKVDGIVFIAATPEEAQLRKIARRRIPLVVVDRPVREIDSCVVLVDNRQGGHAATRHLIALGHRRVACIAGPRGLGPSEDRVRGYHNALSEAGIAADPTLVVHGDFRIEGGELAQRRLLALPDRPTAVFAANDMTALGALRATRESGLTVPEDVSIVGFDDIPLASLIDPPLTTVRQPSRQLGEIAVHELLRRIEHVRELATPSPPIVLRCQLVVRESCAPPRARV